MSGKEWIVVGISGATCSGKSTLARRLHKIFPLSIYLCQDDYFFPPDSPHHVKVESLGHLNWEIMSALDMKKMREDVHSILHQGPVSASLPARAKQSEAVNSDLEFSLEGTYPFVLIIEGFLLLNDPFLYNICDFRYYLTLTKDQCWDRRRVRIYDPPDVPGYFDLVVWPEYVKHHCEVLKRDNVKFIDGMSASGVILKDVVNDVVNFISQKRGSQ